MRRSKEKHVLIIICLMLMSVNLKSFIIHIVNICTTVKNIYWKQHITKWHSIMYVWISTADGTRAFWWEFELQFHNNLLNTEWKKEKENEWHVKGDCYWSIFLLLLCSVSHVFISSIKFIHKETHLIFIQYRFFFEHTQLPSIYIYSLLFWTSPAE